MPFIMVVKIVTPLNSKPRFACKEAFFCQSISLPLLCFFITFFLFIDISTAPRLIPTSIQRYLNNERRVTLSSSPYPLCLTMITIYVLHFYFSVDSTEWQRI
jgi:hypothetical protein